MANQISHQANYITAKELYIDAHDLRSAEENCSEDNEDTVSWFKAIQSYKITGEFKEKKPYYRNLLMVAAQRANETLVRYIVEHISDKNVLNLKDNTDRNALHHAIWGQVVFLGRSKSCFTDPSMLGKVMACAKILIDNGIDIDARDTFGETTLAGDFVKTIRKIGEPNPMAITAKKLLELFISKGATCYIAPYGIIDGETKPDDPEDKKQYSQIVETAKMNVMWSKLRLLVLANRSPESSIKALPNEITPLIAEQLAALTLPKSPDQ